MVIKKIKVTNFKSFKNLEIDLRNFNVLIGPNASGKSNFIQIFQFLKHIVESGFENAVSLQGGEYLPNLSLGLNQNLSFSILFTDCDYRIFRDCKRKKMIAFKPEEFIYYLNIKFYSKGLRYDITDERLIEKGEFFEIDQRTKNIKGDQILGRGEITLSRTNGNIQLNLKTPFESDLNENDFLPHFLLKDNLEKKISLLQTPNMAFVFPDLREVLSELTIYDFDPKLPKRATPITGKAELEPNGTNLAIVLKNILGQKKNLKKLYNLINNILPFIHKLNVEKFADKSLLFNLKETFFELQYLPASLISDGTINVLLLIIALYFEKKNFIIFEEPERNIHPYLISKVVEMMKDASQNKQMIITTHNPEIIKYAGLENILLIARDKNGFSSVTRATDQEEIKIFLEQEIGIEELFIQNLLGN